jgi:membrane-associated protein
MARFVPVLRALIPMFAGMTGFSPRRYLLFNIVGAVAWVVGLMLVGFLLGQVSFVREHVEVCVLAFVILTSLPLPIELLRARLKHTAEARVSTAR